MGGFNAEEAHGRVFLFEIPGRPEPVEQNPNPGQDHKERNDELHNHTSSSDSRSD